MIRSVPAMLDCLWGIGRTISRAYWETKPFRTYYTKARKVLARHPPLLALWERDFQTEFLRYHWILPYPDGNGTLVSTAKKTRKRQWFSVLPEGALRFIWGKDRFHKGIFPAYPQTLQMSTQELKRYISAL